jgi:hypothetical protein
MTLLDRIVESCEPQVIRFFGSLSRKNSTNTVLLST